MKQSFFSRLSIRQCFTFLAAVIAALMATIVVAAIVVNRSNAELSAAHENRYRSYLLAAELRQSSDDLTRLARTYVLTGDPRYEAQYQAIIDIRDGKKARPQHYERIYWDFVAADGKAPRPDGSPAALVDLMKQAGFTEAELGKLNEAKGNSDALVQKETIAMNAVKGRFDDGKGGFTRVGEPDLAMARTITHDQDYHAAKGKIMRPVDEFFAMLDQRTTSETVAARDRAEAMGTLIHVLIAVSPAILVTVLVLTYRSIQRPLADAVGIARSVSEGDLTGAIEVHSSSETGQLLSALKEMKDGLAGIVGEVRTGADVITTSANEIATGTLDLSSRTEQQASSLEETAASMEELTATVRQNADNARQANQLAATASRVAAEGGGVVAQVVDTMGAINESSKKIVDIIAVIDGIAFQTNILALNAAVEAARAGEQGRGFAVVASEVRNLAQRSAAAAKEIKSLINDSVGKVDTGSMLVEQAGATMREVVDSVRRVTDIMTEIATASAEQSSGIEEVNRAIAQMDQVTQQNAALVEEASAAAESMQDQAGKLAHMVSAFRLEPGAAARPGTLNAAHSANQARLAGPVAKAGPGTQAAPRRTMSAIGAD